MTTTPCTHQYVMAGLCAEVPEERAKVPVRTILQNTFRHHYYCQFCLHVEHVGLYTQAEHERMALWKWFPCKE